MLKMENSRLVQRLTKPKGHPPNPFTFGGGYKNGGLSDEAFDIIREIFDFEYMGAAEYEFGALPKAFQKVGKLNPEKNYVGVTMPIKSKNADEIYILCHKDWVDEIKNRITQWYKDEYSPSITRVKRGVHLKPRLEEDREYFKDTVGWFELNNGFFFFIDRDMFENTSKLIGVEV